MLETLFGLILIVIGAWFLIRLKLHSPKKRLDLIKYSFEKEKSGRSDGVSPFKAFAASLGGSVGTGNIAGVAGAIIVGGPGTIVWMFISSVFSEAIKYCEVMLSIRIRRPGKENFGSISYIEKVFANKLKFMPLAYAVLLAITAFFIGNMVQSNTIADTAAALFSSLTDIGEDGLFLVKLISGLIVGFFLLITLNGGGKRVFSALGFIVPIISVIYVLAGLLVIAVNIDSILPVIKLMLSDAFSSARPAASGILGFAFVRKASIGLTRGIFSNEAGLGSSAVAHADSTSKNPVKEGALGILEVFIDTVLICGITAFTILLSGVNVPYGDASASNMALASEAFSSLFKTMPANIFLTFSVALFAYSSMLSWAYYGLMGIKYAFKGAFLSIYKYLFCFLAVIGAVLNAYVVWDAANILNLLLSIPNVLALIALFKSVRAETLEFYFSKRHRTLYKKN